MTLTRRQALGTVTAAVLVAATSGVALAAEAVRLSTLEDLAQKLAEQAAQDAIDQGWKVSPDKIESARIRILQDLRESFEGQQIAVRTC